MSSLESQHVVFNFCFYFVLLYNKSLKGWSLGEFCFPRIAMFPSTLSRGNIEILGKQNSLFPSGPVIKC